MLIQFLYNRFIYVYAGLINLAAYFSKKAKLWVNGRKHIFEKIQSKFDESKSQSARIWVHCASLGEFEQGRPLIEKIKANYPDKKIVLTFFSPSGYEVRKNYPGADFIFYLPIDTVKNAKHFIAIVRPEAAFFIKYEFWFNYLMELKKKNIPTYLVSGIFRENHYFFKPYGAWFRQQLGCFTHFFLQSKTSEILLNKIGYTNTTVCGDTRFDRVYEIAKNVKMIPLVSQFCNSQSVFIAGSTWSQDEHLLSTFNFQTFNFKLIIAPHEIDENHIQSIEKLFPVRCLRFSQATEATVATADVLIIDNIGMLSSLYQYASIAYVGGGFGKGIHNILEPATFGMPIIIGPNYHKFTEAIDLIERGGAFSVNSKVELSELLQKLKNSDLLSNAALQSKQYVQNNLGATNKILTHIKWSN